MIISTTVRCSIWWHVSFLFCFACAQLFQQECSYFFLKLVILLSSAWNEMRKNWCWHTSSEWNKVKLKGITFVIWQKRYSCFPRRNVNELTLYLHIQKEYLCILILLIAFLLLERLFPEVFSPRLAADQILWKPAPPWPCLITVWWLNLPF